MEPHSVHRVQSALACLALVAGCAPLSSSDLNGYYVTCPDFRPPYDSSTTHLIIEDGEFRLWNSGGDLKTTHHGEEDHLAGSVGLESATLTLIDQVTAKAVAHYPIAYRDGRVTLGPPTELARSSNDEDGYALLGVLVRQGSPDWQPFDLEHTPVLCER